MPESTKNLPQPVSYYGPFDVSAAIDLDGHESKFDVERECAIQSRDALDLAKTGKKQILKRRFGLLSMIGFSCTLMITWEGVLTDFSLGLNNGGPAGLVYGYLVTWLGTLSVFISMGELASMFPTAGGQYHWVSVLAPQKSRKLLSYVTGWATVVSWVAAATAISFFTATLMQAAVVLNHPSYDPKGWQGWLIMLGILLLSTSITTALGKILPTLEVVLLLLHILGFFGTVIPLIYHASTRSPTSGKQVFSEFFNVGGWSTQTLSFFVGLIGNATALLGTDGAIHMSEEVEMSAINVPRSILVSVLINGSAGFAMLLSVLFSVDNIGALTQSTATYPFMDILASSYNSVGGATTIVALIVFMNFAASLAVISSSGRMMWSFARDRGLPGWQWLRQVDSRTSIPFNTIIVTIVIGIILGIINVGSSTAFQDIVSLVLVGFYLSYLLAISLLLYRRLRGDIVEPGRQTTDTFEPTPTYVWGPWRLKGWLGTLNNLFGVCYLTIVGFFCFWPGSSKVTAVDMNYSSVVLGSVMILSMVWYFVRARKYYTGPVVETHNAF